MICPFPALHLNSVSLGAPACLKLEKQNITSEFQAGGTQVDTHLATSRNGEKKPVCWSQVSEHKARRSGKGPSEGGEEADWSESKPVPAELERPF